MAGGAAMIVALQDKQLLMQPRGGNALPIFPESEARFFIRGMNVRVEFVRDAAGAVTELVIHQGTRQDRARTGASGN